MNERIENALKVFRYKRTNIKAVSWGLAILLLVGGIFLLNALSELERFKVLQNPYVTFGLYLVLLVGAAALFTYYNDFKLRKALAELDFIVDELKDPQTYLSILDGFGRFDKRMVTPAYLHAKLRAMMYASSDREIQEFVNKFEDVMGDSLNIESALFRIKSYGEKRQNVDSFEAIITKKLDKAYAKAKTNAIRASIDHQRKWLDVQTMVVRLKFNEVLKVLELLQEDECTPLESVRINYYKGLAYARLGHNKQAREAFTQVIHEGNTTRFVHDAKGEYEKVRN
ncbi:hypothetical protein AOC36_02250 [Erysipelothrix larvae]|uniref:Uncharacterized protein n=1 Tax=Erysipelothrix larvae TaxID=1514105 RepID=A0A0X8GYP8_9FIRM|nr:hypothetical protein [Erysipelothrix larvae]AMC92847.1 hypothetical protein AOC36_02250 [Erysipelothrix larvae]